MSSNILRTAVFIATSLDGFIAREDGDIDWLTYFNEHMDNDGGYEAFIQTVDAIIMGRSSYEKVLSFPQWPYSKQVIVLSRKDIEIPENLRNQGVSSSESPHELCNSLARKGLMRLYIDGGVTIQRFIRAGKIDDITITVVPVLIGRGKPLFGEIDSDIALRHMQTTVYSCGFVQTKYKIMLDQ